MGSHHVIQILVMIQPWYMTVVANHSLTCRKSCVLPGDGCPMCMAGQDAGKIVKDTKTAFSFDRDFCLIALLMILNNWLLGV